MTKRRVFYSVVVSNIGNVYSGGSKGEARRAFEHYVTQSKLGTGRAGGESVVMFAGYDDPEMIEEYTGALAREEY